MKQRETRPNSSAPRDSAATQHHHKRRLSGVGILLGLLRVGLVATLGYCGIAYWLAHEAGAHAVERVGKGLDGLAGLIGPSETVELNGKPVHISSEVVPESVNEVRSKLRRHCSNETTAVGSGQLGAMGPEQLLWQELGNDEERMTVCFRPRVPIETWVDLGQRLVDVVSSGDVTALGEVRFARIRSQGEHSTHVLLAHTDDGFSLANWFDDARDAPGVDPAHAPRPPHARRLLSARVHGAKAGAYGYNSTESSEALRTFYATSLPTRGFARIATRDANPAQSDIYASQDSFIVLGVTPGEGGQLVNIVETPRYDD